MDTEATPRDGHGGGNPLTIFVTSLSAAIVVAGGFGIIIQAFILAGADLFRLGSTFIWVTSILNGVVTLWLFVWTFARSVHVERRLRLGLEVDEPHLSILGNLRGLGPTGTRASG
jgi:hypothetical protein